MSEFDLFVIGGGSGGVGCARRAAAHGAKVGLAESSRMGGTCVIRGCVPKKLMHYGAHFADHFEAARSYGWQLGDPALDLEALLAARNREIDRLNSSYIRMLETAGVAIFAGHARLLGGSAEAGFTIDAAGAPVRARRVLVATGARPYLPEIPGIEHAITSDEVLESVYPLPRRLVVVGAGYIGVELASILSGLGAETRLVYRADLPLRGFDHELRTILAEELALRGLRLHPMTQVSRITRDGVSLRLATTAGELEADMVVYATGRRPLPNTRGIGLEALGVRLDPEGAILVDGSYASSVPGILAVGDCSDHAGSGVDSGQFDLTPVAIAEGRAVAERLFNANPQTVRYDTLPTAIFALPQAGAIGLSEAAARARGHDITVFKTRFRPMLHTLTGSAERVFMKLVVDKPSDRVLGCFMVGGEAAETIQGFAVALTAGATKAEFDATVALHPTAAEEFVTMYQPAG